MKRRGSGPDNTKISAGMVVLESQEPTYKLLVEEMGGGHTYHYRDQKVV